MLLGRRIEWLRHRLTELEQQKNRFLRQVSHELKTPLTALREGSELLTEEALGKLTPEQQEKVRAMKDTQRSGGRGLEQLREELGLSDGQLAQMKKIREEGGSRQDMAKVLTPGQKEKLDQMKQRQRSPHRAPPRSQGTPPVGEVPPGWGLKKSE